MAEEGGDVRGFDLEAIGIRSKLPSPKPLIIGFLNEGLLFWISLTIHLFIALLRGCSSSLAVVLL